MTTRIRHVRLSEMNRDRMQRWNAERENQSQTQGSMFAQNKPGQKGLLNSFAGALKEEGLALYHAVTNPREVVSAIEANVKANLDAYSDLTLARARMKEPGDRLLKDASNVYNDVRNGNYDSLGRAIEGMGVSVLPIGKLLGAGKFALFATTGMKVAKGGESLVSTGGRKLTSASAALKADQEAAEFYNQVRNANSKADISLISKSTGIPEYRIERIKNHIFMEEHQLTGGRIDRFDPYIEISDAWKRLQSGDFYKQDVDLLHHEYFESRFQRISRLTTIQRITQQ